MNINIQNIVKINNYNITDFIFFWKHEAFKNGEISES